MTENDLSSIIVNGAIEVHRTLGGPGLLESVYEKVVPLVYKGKRLATDLRVDLLKRGLRVERQEALVHQLKVGGLVIVECEAAREHNPVFEAHTLTYLRLIDLKLGLVINFGRRLVKDGIHRVVNRL